jgi:hypothetical protein
MALFLPVGAKPPEQAETGHWYDRAGKPCYQQTTAKGALRGTDLRDARKQGLVPSVTTVLSVLAKPALETWKVKQGILAALTLPRNAGEADDAYLARVLVDSREQAKAAAEEGSRIHDACECAIKGLPYPEKYRWHVKGALDRLADLFPDVDDWVAEASFAHDSGFGGKVDLHSPSTGIVADYKTTDERSGSTKKFHWDQHYQLASYQNGLSLPRRECANIFVSRTEPGTVFSHKWTAEDIEEGWQVFAASLELWKRLRKFDPSFTTQSQAA